MAPNPAPPNRPKPPTPRTLLLTACLTLGTVLAMATPAAADHLCGALQVTTSPANVYAGDKVDYSVLVTNRNQDAAEVALRLRFGWETQSLNWGTLTIPPGESRVATYSKVITDQPADYAVTITPQATGAEEAACPALARSLRVERLPDAPTLVITPSATHLAGPGNASFQAATSGGLGPFAYAWSFGDGTTAQGSTVSHEFLDPGTYEVQAVVTDARGRTDVDRVHIVIAAPPTGGASFPWSALAVGLAAFVGVVLGSRLAPVRWTRSPTAPEPFPESASSLPAAASPMAREPAAPTTAGFGSRLAEALHESATESVTTAPGA